MDVALSVTPGTGRECENPWARRFPDLSPVKLEKALEPAVLAVALHVRRVTAAARPLREHDPAEVDDLHRDRRREERQQLRMAHPGESPRKPPFAYGPVVP